MTDDERDLTPEELAEYERLIELLSERQRLSDEATVEALAALMDRETDLLLLDDEVVLFGPEGQIDAVMRVPEPRPWILLRPIHRSMNWTLKNLDTPPSPDDLRVAEYERIAEATYRWVRVS